MSLVGKTTLCATEYLWWKCLAPCFPSRKLVQYTMSRDGKHRRVRSESWFCHLLRRHINFISVALIISLYVVYVPNEHTLPFTWGLICVSWWDISFLSNQKSIFAPSFIPSDDNVLLSNLYHHHVRRILTQVRAKCWDQLRMSVVFHSYALYTHKNLKTTPVQSIICPYEPFHL